MLGRLKNWSNPIEGLRSAFRLRAGRSKNSNTITASSRGGDEIVLPQNASHATIMTRNNILTLWRALEHSKTSDLHMILTNTELLAFAISWFTQVCMFIS
jgi:hypothetical protein